MTLNDSDTYPPRTGWVYNYFYPDIAGFTVMNKNATVDNCYYAGIITNSTANVTLDGLVNTERIVYNGTIPEYQIVYDAGAVTNSYWDTQLSGVPTSDAGTGTTTSPMKAEGTFFGWDFSTIWDIDALINDGYPYLLSLLEEPPDPTPPTIATLPATAITSSTATLNGNITSMGVAANTRAYFQYGYGIDYGQTTPQVTKSATGAFSAPITGLVPSATVHYRAISNWNGVLTYGNDVVFQTLTNESPTPTPTPTGTATPPPTTTAAAPPQDSASNPNSTIIIIIVGVLGLVALLFGVDRVKTIGLIAFAFAALWAVWGTITSVGNTSASTPGAPAYYGFTWMLQNLVWLFLIVIVGIAAFVLMGGRKALDQLIGKIRK
jgi:hypothetical protein